MELQNGSEPSQQLTRQQKHYIANKERLNAMRCAKAKVEAARKRQIKGILRNIKDLFAGITGDNFVIAMEDPHLKNKYNSLICEIREKHLETLKQV